MTNEKEKGNDDSVKDKIREETLEISRMENAYEILYNNLVNNEKSSVLGHLVKAEPYNDKYDYDDIAKCVENILSLINKNLILMEDDRKVLFSKALSYMKDEYEIVDNYSVGGHGMSIDFVHKSNASKIFDVFIPPKDIDVQLEEGNVEESYAVWEKIFRKYWVPKLHEHYMDEGE
ncbi:hypothetical protein AKJ51_04215 [candidate division MSBL1 archaeon SCGC-AAA382A20]|uniref:Uncharacterized protein n=1 Tax=candidate division MSBL1 archaeon SCGC-AAA382A20 TaxID=1698280 RepID=A0A133VI42_9EURY|nr:hypothetical protein AKJ51_04215 [candidate division MSBL1 archaeon SCGC-AAA382A20]